MLRPALITANSVSDNLTLDNPSYCGILITANSTLHISGCTVIAEGDWGIAGNGGNPPTEGLTITNAVVKVHGIRGSIVDFKYFTLSDCTITAPVGAEFDPSLKGVALNSLVVKDQWVEISPSGTGLETLTSQGIAVRGGKGLIEIELPLSPLNGELSVRAVSVYNVSGALVHSAALSGEQTFLSVDAGIYIVRIGNAAKKVVVW